MTAPKTAAERQRARRQRLADAGLAQVTVIVPARREAEIKAIADSMRAGSASPEDHTKPISCATFPTS